MVLRSYVVLAIVLVVASAGFAITRTSGSTEVFEQRTTIDVDVLHSKIDLNTLRAAAAYDAF